MEKAASYSILVLYSDSQNSCYVKNNFNLLLLQTRLRYNDKQSATPIAYDNKLLSLEVLMISRCRRRVRFNWISSFAAYFKG